MQRIFSGVFAPMYGADSLFLVRVTSNISSKHYRWLSAKLYGVCGIQIDLAGKIGLSPLYTS